MTATDVSSTPPASGSLGETAATVEAAAARTRGAGHQNLFPPFGSTTAAVVGAGRRTVAPAAE